MGRMSDLDIVRQEHGLPTDTPLEVLIALEKRDPYYQPDGLLVRSGDDDRD